MSHVDVMGCDIAGALCKTNYENMVGWDFSGARTPI